MPGIRPCKLCTAPFAKELAKGILDGVPIKVLAARFDIVTFEIYRHRKHVPGYINKIGQDQGGAHSIVPKVPTAPEVPSRPELPPGASDIEKVDADIQWIEARRKSLEGTHVSEKDLSALTAQLISARRLRASLSGNQISSGQYVKSPHFRRIWGAVVDVLREHPKALAAVKVALVEASGIAEAEL